MEADGRYLVDVNALQSVVTGLWTWKVCIFEIAAAGKASDRHLVRATRRQGHFESEQQALEISRSVQPSRTGGLRSAMRQFTDGACADNHGMPSLITLLLFEAKWDGRDLGTERRLIQLLRREKERQIEEHDQMMLQTEEAITSSRALLARCPSWDPWASEFVANPSDQ